MYNEYMASYEGAFVHIYDKRWGLFSQRMAPHIVRFLERELPDSHEERPWVCDLCCGTGQLAHYLGHHGYNVEALDIADDMLAKCREKLAGLVAHGHARINKQDARGFHVTEPVHAVISLFDSLNHLSNRTELVDCFRHAYDAIIPGGMFLFDLNTKKGLERWNNVEIDEQAHWFVVTRGIFDDAVATMRVTGFIELDGVWERFHQTFYNTVFGMHDVELLLKEVGFRQVRFLQAPSLEPIRDDAENHSRVFIASTR